MRGWVLLLGVGSACLAQVKNPLSGDAQAAEAGRAIFRIYCSPCHGIRAGGGRGPDLTHGTWSAGDQDADLFRVINEGVGGTEMPSFSTMGDDNIWRLVAYTRSLARRDIAGIPGDRAAGGKLFWGKGACGQCHTVGPRGGRLGPDLSRVGRTRSLAYLRESVVAPNEDLTPGYYAITVVTRDGRTITGVQRGFDNFSAQLMDSGEKIHSFLRSEVVSITREYRSLMPDTYGRLFKASELDDLLAYLASLRGEEVNP